VDLSKRFPEQEIRKAFLEHQVVFFRDQELDPAQFMAFARQLGRPIEYPFVKGIEGFPEVIEVKKLEHEKHNFGGIWHSDTAYLQEPPMGSMLLSKEVPPYGGDTMFASQYAAYDALTDTMKRLLDGLVGISSSAKADVSKTREDRIKDGGTDEAKKEYRAEHPIVRTHPETGRKTLYVNIAFTRSVVGMDEEEGRALLARLFRQSTLGDVQWRFRWQPGSVAFWDNRATQHVVSNDFLPARRVMERVTVVGDKPF
jgi:taurine dioxygenase